METVWRLERSRTEQIILPESEKVKQQIELWLEVETVDGLSILVLPWMGLRSSEAFLLFTVYPSFARGSSEIPWCRTRGRPSRSVIGCSGQDRLAWEGHSRSLLAKSAQGKSKTKGTTPGDELAQKESDYNKASANERLLEKKLQKSTETVEKLRK